MFHYSKSYLIYWPFNNDCESQCDSHRRNVQKEIVNVAQLFLHTTLSWSNFNSVKELKWPDELALKAKFLLRQSFCQYTVESWLFPQSGKSHVDSEELLRNPVRTCPQVRQESLPKNLKLVSLTICGLSETRNKTVSCSSTLSCLIWSKGNSWSHKIKGTAAFQSTMWKVKGLFMFGGGKLWFRIGHDRTSWVLPRSILGFPQFGYPSVHR